MENQAGEPIALPQANPALSNGFVYIPIHTVYRVELWVQRLASRAGQLRTDARKRRIDVGREGLHGGDGAEGDQGRDQRVFNQILAGFVIVQTAKYIQNFYF